MKKSFVAFAKYGDRYKQISLDMDTVQGAEVVIGIFKTTLSGAVDNLDGFVIMKVARVLPK